MNNQTEQQIDPMEFRRALGHFASGITIITTKYEGAPHGMTANAFTSVSLNPPLVLVSIDNRAHMHKLLAATGRYGVSILNEEQEALARHFAGRPQEDLDIQFEWQRDIPLIKDAVTHLVCTVTDPHPAGDHTLYIGQVEYLDYQYKPPLMFYSGMYQTLNVQFREYPYWW